MQVHLLHNTIHVLLRRTKRQIRLPRWLYVCTGTIGPKDTSAQHPMPLAIYGGDADLKDVAGSGAEARTDTMASSPTASLDTLAAAAAAASTMPAPQWPQYSALSAEYVANVRLFWGAADAMMAPFCRKCNKMFKGAEDLFIDETLHNPLARIMCKECVQLGDPTAVIDQKFQQLAGVGRFLMRSSGLKCAACTPIQSAPCYNLEGLRQHVAQCIELIYCTLCCQPVAMKDFEENHTERCIYALRHMRELFMSGKSCKETHCMSCFMAEYLQPRMLERNLQDP